MNSARVSVRIRVLGIDIVRPRANIRCRIRVIVIIRNKFCLWLGLDLW
jgi:hypothetical protein